MRRMATVDHRRGGYVICSLSSTVSGFWAINDHQERIDDTAGAAELGSAVVRALAASGANVPDPPPSGPAALAPLLRAADVRSYGAYMQGTRHVDVEQENATVTVTPNRNDGARGGFVPLVEAAEVLTDPTPATLAAAVQRALERAT
jgi:hypothetical protein